MAAGRILVFAKAPVAGRAKTRLIPALGAEGAAALQGALIRHTLRTALNSDGEVVLWCHPDPSHPEFARYAKQGIACRTQEGADLGERMFNAAANFADGPVVIIGTDCPDLPSADLNRTLTLLATHQAVLGPALDGGYYLLGLQRAHRALFDGIEWGTDRVLGQTRDRLRRLGWSWSELAPRRDIDRPEDLAWLNGPLKKFQRPTNA
jgi:rSAM/selenodomain-associated transferase 1